MKFSDRVPARRSFLSPFDRVRAWALVLRVAVGSARMRIRETRARIASAGMLVVRVLPMLPMLFLGSLVFSVSCSEDNPTIVDEPPPEPPPYPPRTSPAELLQGFERAYEERNLAEYQALFDTQRFTMDSELFTDGFWDWDFERKATRNMFSIAGVDTVILNFRAGEARPLDVEGEVEVELGQLSLLVQDTVAGSFRLTDRTLILHLREDSSDPDDLGRPTWKITRWIAEPEVEDRLSWARLKFFYYKECPICP